MLVMTTARFDQNVKRDPCQRALFELVFLGAVGLQWETFLLRLGCHLRNIPQGLRQLALLVSDLLHTLETFHFA